MTGDFDFQIGKWVRFQGRGARALVALAMMLLFLSCLVTAAPVVTGAGITWIRQLSGKLGY